MPLLPPLLAHPDIPLHWTSAIESCWSINWSAYSHPPDLKARALGSWYQSMIAGIYVAVATHPWFFLPLKVT